MRWLRKHWLTLVGFFTLVPSAWKGIKFLIGRGGDADFVIARLQDPGWVGTMINFLLSPPPAAHLPLIVAGLGLIYWDARRNRRPTLTSLAGQNATPLVVTKKTVEDASRKLAAVDSALDILDASQPLSLNATGANSLRAIWAEQVATPEQFAAYRHSLATNRESFRKAMRGLHEAIETSARYPDIAGALEAVKAADYQLAFDEFTEFHKRLDPPLSANQRAFFEPYDKRCRAAVLAFKAEVENARGVLLRLRQDTF